MTTYVQLNHYRVQDTDLGVYVLEGDGLLVLFVGYQSALDYAKLRGYDLEDHCN